MSINKWNPYMMKVNYLIHSRHVGYSFGLNAKNYKKAHANFASRKWEQMKTSIIRLARWQCWISVSRGLIGIGYVVMRMRAHVRVLFRQPGRHLKTGTFQLEADRNFEQKTSHCERTLPFSLELHFTTTRGPHLTRKFSQVN